MGQETDDALDRNVENLQLEALEAVQKMIFEDEGMVKAHRETGKRLMDDAVAQKRERAERIAEAGVSNRNVNVKGKGKAPAANIESDFSSDEYDSDDDDTFGDTNDGKVYVRSKQWKWWLKTEKGKGWKQRNKTISAKRRENLMLLHKTQLSLGDTYFRLKDSENESKYYAYAEETRVQLLGGTFEKFEVLSSPWVFSKQLRKRMQSIPFNHYQRSWRRLPRRT